MRVNTHTESRTPNALRDRGFPPSMPVRRAATKVLFAVAAAASTIACGSDSTAPDQGAAIPPGGSAGGSGAVNTGGRNTAGADAGGGATTPNLGGAFPSGGSANGQGAANSGGGNTGGANAGGGAPANACGHGPDGAEPLAFPGAEGFGATTPGGRGGEVIEVTNLDDSGPGSLRHALEQVGPRTIVFRVSGTIEMESDITVENPNVTVAGQTAPGDGIALKNYQLMISADDVIVRYLRFRRGRANEGRTDSLSISWAENVIVDHCSMSWGTDQTLSTWIGTKNITVQWSIISEALHHNSHGFAASLGGVSASYHHLLFANCPGRNPSIAGNHEHQTHNLDFRNSVIFNFGHRTFDGKPSSINIVNNYFKPGPSSEVTHFAEIDEAGAYEAIPTTAWYISGNVWEGNPAISEDNAAGVIGAVQWLIDEPVAFAPVRTVSAEEAYNAVLDDVGATLPKRDPVDERIINEVATGVPTFGDGVVLHPSDVGGYPDLASTDPPADDDHDGMPNTWETAQGLDPADPADGKAIQSDGYSNLEHYLNCIGQ